MLRNWPILICCLSSNFTEYGVLRTQLLFTTESHSHRIAWAGMEL